LGTGVALAGISAKPAHHPQPENWCDQSATLVTNFWGKSLGKTSAFSTIRRSSFYYIEEMEMAISMTLLERRARYVMSVVAFIALAGWASWEMGWITTAPSYKEEAWYLVGGSTSFVITSEYADEASCRRNENAASVCQPGKVLIQQAGQPS
jgi:hypothetical protein